MYFDTTNRGSCSRASPDQIAEINRSRSLDSPRYLSFYLTPIIHRDIRVDFFADFLGKKSLRFSTGQKAKQLVVILE